jgi:hypothetical protein
MVGLGALTLMLAACSTASAAQASERDEDRDAQPDEPDDDGDAPAPDVPDDSENDSDELSSDSDELLFVPPARSRGFLLLSARSAYARSSERKPPSHHVGPEPRPPFAA